MKKIILLIPVFFAIKAIANDFKIGDSLYAAGLYKEAIPFFNKYLNENKKLGNKEKADIYARKGTCFNYMGENNPAIENYFESVKYSELSGYKLGQAKAYYNIANIYFSIQEYDKSEKYIEQSHVLFTSLKDSISLAALYGVMASIYNETKGSRESIDVRLFALRNFEKFFDDYLLQLNYLNLGHSYINYKSDSALFYFNKTLDLFPKVQDSSFLPFSYNSIGYIYLEKKDLPRTKKYLELALATDYVNTDTLQTRNLYDNLARMYNETGSFKLAYEFAAKAKGLTKQLFSKDKSKAQSELSEKYEAEKKDQQIAQQQKENRNKNIALIATSLVIVLVALLALFSYRQYRKKQAANQMLEKQNHAIQILNAKLSEANQTKANLFSVISHDLRAPLSSLYALLQMTKLKEGESERALQINTQTEQVLDTLENLLLWSKTQLDAFSLNIQPTQLPERCKQVEALFAAIITSKKIRINTSIEGVGNLHSDQDVLDIILRNIYSNALQNAPENSRVLLHHQLYDNLHIFECVNEYDPSKTNPTAFFSERGLGTTLIKDFCEKINATVHFSAGESSFTVLLKVPSVQKA